MIRLIFQLLILIFTLDDFWILCTRQSNDKKKLFVYFSFFAGRYFHFINEIHNFVSDIFICNIVRTLLLNVSSKSIEIANHWFRLLLEIHGENFHTFSFSL